MFKNGYKIIFIKEGKYHLRQFDLTPLKILLIASFFIFISFSFFLVFSDQFTNWAGSREINKHRENNKVLIDDIKGSKQRIEHIIDQLEDIKKLYHILR